LKRHVVLGPARCRGCGLLLSVDPSLTPAQVGRAMDSTATDLGLSGYDKHYGYGLVDACAAVAAVGGDCG
jgi:hypothetical protein